MKTQLLCTFANIDDVDGVVDIILKEYTLSNKYIYVLKNRDADGDLYLTYNILGNQIANINYDTILLHRKKETNTLYTINALNTIIRNMNNGILDMQYQIDWNAYQNSLLITNKNVIRIIHTVIEKVIVIN